jgi:ElaB/YqjD/DUF883 family membrane-anchored ribosome-binding protein
MSDTNAEINAAASDVNEEFEIAKKAVMDAYSNFLEAKKHLKKAAIVAGFEFKESAKEHLDEAIGKVSQKKDAVVECTGNYVRENPITTVSAAFVGGMIFSRLFGK